MCIDCGRNGIIESTFVAEEDKFVNLIGKSFYIDEPFGKHSELSGVFQEEYFIKTECSSDVLEAIELLNILPTGYYPFDFVTN